MIFAFSVFSVAAGASVTRTMSNLVVFVKYSSAADDEFNQSTNWNKIKSYYNDTTSLYSGYGNVPDLSFKNYINTISRGAVNIENYFPQDRGDTVNTLTLAHDHDYYTDDYYVISEVMAAFNSGKLTLPDDKLDYVESEVLDCLTIITQANNNDYPDDEVLYPHKSVYGSADKINNKYYVRGYILMDSYSVIHGQRTGVIAHEYMHIMGFPDLYRRFKSGTPVGIWDIMASTSDYKQYPLSYMRYINGWVPLKEAAVSGTYTLDAVSMNTDNAVMKLKTPMSDSEFFCVEYRKRNTENVVAGLGFETKVYSGLLIYRVNNAVENHTNNAGNDYLYVFRPNDTSLTDGGGEILNAPVSPDQGETSYGSADFNAKFSDNTIFYSSGKNSGIVITNVAYTNDGNSITFDVTYPDYSSLNLWDKIGSPFGSGITSNPELAIDGNNIYIAALASTDWSFNVKVFKWNGTTWSDMGGTFSDAYDQKIAVFNGTPYLVYTNSNGNPVLWKYTGSSWSKIATVTSAQYPMSMNFFSDENNLYLTYGQDSNTIVIDKVTSSGLTEIDRSLTTSNSFSNYALASFNGKLYALYSYFGWNLAEKRAIISEYDMQSKTWSDVEYFDISNSNIHTAVVRDGKLYCMSGSSGKNPMYAVYDGESWTTGTAELLSTNYSGLAVDAAGDEMYIAYLSGTGLNITKHSNGNWVNIGEVSSDCSYFSFKFDKGKAIVPCTSGASENVVVYCKQLYVDPVNITAPSNKVAQGLTMKLTAKGGTGEYFWSSENERILTVSSDGTVKGIKQGGATVTATDSDGNKATYFVKVTQNNGTISVYVIVGSQNQKIDWWKPYSSAKMKVAYVDNNCENAVSFKWTSSNSSVKIDGNGNVRNYGIFSRSSVLTMTAYDADGNIVAKGSIKVRFYKLGN